MDRRVGDFENGQVLIQGKKIMSVGAKLEAPNTAVIVDAAGMILMPAWSIPTTTNTRCCSGARLPMV